MLKSIKIKAQFRRWFFCSLHSCENVLEISIYIVWWYLKLKPKKLTVQKFLVHSKWTYSAQRILLSDKRGLKNKILKSVLVEITITDKYHLW